MIVAHIYKEDDLLHTSEVIRITSEGWHPPFEPGGWELRINTLTQVFA